MAESQPDSIALEHHGRTLTYGELVKSVHRIGRGLRAQGWNLREPVAITVTDPIDAFCTALGTLAAGGWFAFIPAKASEEQVARILEACASHPVLLTAESDRATFADGVFVGDVPQGHKTRLPARANPLLCLIPTSGTTGASKLVIQTQRNILFESVWRAEVQAVTPNDTFSLLYPLGSVGSMQLLVNALVNGARLVIAEIAEVIEQGLAHWLVEHAVTNLSMPPSVFRKLASTDQDAYAQTRVRIFALGGEPVHRNDLELFGKRFPDAYLSMSLGSTESGSVRYLFVPAGSVPVTPEGIVPLGFAAPAKTLLVQDTSEPQPMVYQSSFLSPGIWPMPRRMLSRCALRRVRTVESDDNVIVREDGVMMHGGRSDGITKIHGEKVSVFQVESALRAIDGVADALVLPLNTSSNTPYLGAVVVPTEANAVTTDRISYLLRRALTPLAIPKTILILDELPRAATGKADIGAVRTLLTNAPVSVDEFVRDLPEDERRFWGCASDTTFPFLTGALRHGLLGTPWLSTELNQLDIDSLSVAELKEKLQVEYGAVISAEAFAACERLADIKRLAEQS
ncbi:MAG: AMP-binding protein [Microbacteriaceae bacterium]